MDFDNMESIKERLNLSHLSKPALIGIVAILVMVAVAAGRLLIGTATANEFEYVKGETASATAEVASDEVASSTVFVHVSGEVTHPGLVEVAAGSRVADAVQAAGGFTDDAAVESVNLARVISDGEQIVVAGQQEDLTVGSVGSPDVQNAASRPAAGLVNINTAAASELVSLPGIGEATAAKIVSDRQANGSFKTVEDLKRVSGIGEKKFESLAGLICV